MLDELRPLPDTPRPRAGDLVTIHPGGPPHLDPEALYTVADDQVFGHPATLEIHHPTTHPDHHDWAAAVKVSRVATIIRFTENGARTWRTPPPNT